MFDQSTPLAVAGLLLCAAAQGVVAQRVVAGAWRQSLPHELAAGAVIVLLSSLLWVEDYASVAALSLLAATLVVNAVAVLIAHRFPAAHHPVRRR